MVWVHTGKCMATGTTWGQGSAGRQDRGRAKRHSCRMSGGSCWGSAPGRREIGRSVTSSSSLFVLLGNE
jgi:hypothetical protein